MRWNTLHITNGDSAVGLIRAVGIEGEILPWRDVLHDGPVPAGLDLDELAEVRADFLAQPPLMSRDEVRRSFRERDDLVRNWRAFDEVVIWLEHDLYDQLQLLQMLDFFAGEPLSEGFLSMICIDRFPGVEPFYGLGQLSPEQIGSLWGSQQAVTRTQLELGRRGWQAFRADTPLPLFDYASGDLSPLPFMKTALFRHFEEFPDPVDGLGRHERQILQIVSAGEGRPWRLFGDHQKREHAPYLGDWSFFGILSRLTNTEKPLLTTATGEPFKEPMACPSLESFREQRLSITALGEQVLAGKSDWMNLRSPDDWKGGVHLHPDKTIWRWDLREFVFLD